jgi:pimeloyl-ACP methyl ester carboxylesterase
LALTTCEVVDTTQVQRDRRTGRFTASFAGGSPTSEPKSWVLMQEERAGTRVGGTDWSLDAAVDRFLTPRPPRESLRDDDLLGRGAAIRLDCGLAATAWGTGPTVLLAHGWESRRTHWSAFVGPLAEAGFRAVAVDAPAHGESPGRMTNVLEYALMLVDAGRQIGPLAGVVGHSFGAAAAAIALGRGLEATRAVLISGPSSLASVLERWGRAYGLAEQDLPRFLFLVGAKVGEPLEHLDLTHLAAELTTPTLIVHDRNDKEIPVEDAVALASVWRSATIRITERYGHRRIMFAPEVVREVVGFLEGRYVETRPDGT